MEFRRVGFAVSLQNLDAATLPGFTRRYADSFIPAGNFAYDPAFAT